MNRLPFDIRPTTRHFLLSFVLLLTLVTFIAGSPGASMEAGAGETTDFSDLGTFTTPTLVVGPVTVTGSNDINVLNLNGIGIVGGPINNMIDAGESMSFSFTDPASNVRVFQNCGSSNTNGDASGLVVRLAAFDGVGTLLGQVDIFDTGCFIDFSAALGVDPMSRLDVTMLEDSLRIGALTFDTSIADTTPPVPGIVNDGSGEDIDIDTFTTRISANWSGFSDPESGITGFEWAIGTSPGGTDVQGFTSDGFFTEFGISDASNNSLTLTVGATYYVTVRATNGAGLQTTVTSDGVRIQDSVSFSDLGTFTTPTLVVGPVTVTGSNDVNVLNANGLGIGSNNLIGPGETISFSFTDPVSNVRVFPNCGTSGGSIEVGLEAFDDFGALLGQVNVAPGSCLIDFSAALGVDPMSRLDVTLIQNSLRIGGLGFDTAIIDTTPPEPGIVNDGTGADVDSQASTTTIAANWSGFSDPESGITRFEWAIGTSPGGTGVQGFTSVGISTSAANSSLTLTIGTTYYVTVRAINVVGLQTAVTSDGVTISVGATSIVPGIVNDGSGEDIDIDAFTTRISANWSGFSDPESGIAGFEWAIGTSPGGTDVQGFTSDGFFTEEGISDASNFSLTLTVGAIYYVTVRATNGAGDQITVTSDGVRIQDSANFSDLGTFTTPSLVVGPVTVTGSDDVNVLNLNGLGIVGGSTDNRIDSGETISFSFADPVSNVRVVFGCGGGGVLETGLAAFDDSGTLLGQVDVLPGDCLMDFSAALGVDPMSRLDVTLDGGRLLIGALGFDIETSQDSDSDNIFDEVDTQPSVFSNDFSDGTTTGTITARGDQNLAVTDAANGADGVSIKADSSGGVTPATIDTCGGASTFSLNAGDEVIMTCGSVTISVISGTVEITFVSDEGLLATTSLEAGDSLTFEPTAATITAPSSNTSDMVVVIDGTELTLAPGETVQAGVEGEINLTGQIELIGLQHPPAGVTQPGEIYPITAQFRYNGTTTIDDLFFVITEVQHVDGIGPHPELNNRDAGSPAREGAKLTVSLPGGVLNQGDEFEAVFEVLLHRIAPFSAAADAFTIP